MSKYILGPLYIACTTQIWITFDWHTSTTCSLSLCCSEDRMIALFSRPVLIMIAPWTASMWTQSLKHCLTGLWLPGVHPACQRTTALQPCNCPGQKAWKSFIWFGLIPGSPNCKILKVKPHNVNIPGLEARRRGATLRNNHRETKPASHKPLHY